MNLLQTARTCEQEPYIKEVHIKSEPNSEPFCEDLCDVLDELGEILAEAQAVSDYEMKPVNTPPPPSIYLAEDTSLYTRRFKVDNDPSPTNFDKSLETDSKAVGKKSIKGEFIDSGYTQTESHIKPRSSPANADHKRKPTVRSFSKEITAIHVNRAIESNHKTRSSTSADLKQRSKNRRSDSARQRNSRSQSNRRKASSRCRGYRRSISQNSKYCKVDQKRPRSRSSDRIRIRSRRRSSPRYRLDRCQISRCRSRSPDFRRSDYIKYPLTLKRSWAGRNQRHRNRTSSSPIRSHDLSKRHLSRYFPLRLPRRRSRSRSNPGKFSRRRRSRSRSIRSKYPVRNVCNSRPNPARSLTRDRSRSLSKSTKILQRQRRSRSRSMSSTEPLRERSIKFISRHSSIKKSPSAQSQPLLDGAMTDVLIARSYSQTSLSGEQMIQPIKSTSPVIISPRPIAPMITLHDNRISRPKSLRNHLIPTPLAPYMTCMQTHFTNFEYKSASLSYQASGPYNSPSVELAPFDLRHRLDTSRSLHSLGPNDLRHRIQDLYCQNAYLPSPAFNAHAQWPSGYPIGYNYSGYY